MRYKPLDKVERKLSGRGYERIGSGSHGDQQLWWNRDNDRCLRVYVHGQRVSHAEVQDERACRNAGKHGGSHQNEGYSSRSQQRGTSSLIGMRASYLDDEMAQRGYRNVDAYKTSGTSYTVWWNKQMRECMAVRIESAIDDDLHAVEVGARGRSATKLFAKPWQWGVA